MAAHNPPRSALMTLALAERNPRRAVERGRRQLTQPPQREGLEYAWASYALGWALFRWQRLKDMQALIRQATQAFTLAGYRLGTLHCRRIELAGQWMAGAGAELQEHLTALAGEYEAEGAVVEAARVRLLQALHLHTLGKALQALEFIQALSPVLAAWGDPVDDARRRWIEGMALTNTHDSAQAGLLLDAALASFEERRMHPDAGRCRFDRAWLAQRCERFGDALDDLSAAHALASRLDLAYLTAACLKNRGLALSRLGRYGEAIMVTLQARDAYIALGRHDFITGCELNLGIISYYTGLYPLAMAAFQKAEQSYRNLSRIWMMYACQRNQVLVLRAQGELAAALQLLQSLEGPIRQGGDKLEQAEYWQTIAHIRSDLQQYDQAASLFAQASHQFELLDNRPAAAECALELAWLELRQIPGESGAAERRARLDRAEQYLAAAAAELKGRRFHYWRIVYAQGRCAALRNRNMSALQLYIQAGDIVSDLRHEILNAHASSAIFRQAQQLHSDAILLAADQHNTVALIALIEQQRSLNLYDHLQQKSRETQNMASPFPNDLQLQVQALLQHDDSSEAIQTELHAYTERLLHLRHSLPRRGIAANARGDVQRTRVVLDSLYPNGWVAISYTFCDDRLLIMVLDQHAAMCTTLPLSQRLLDLIDYASLPAYRVYTYADLASLDNPDREPWAGLAELGSLLIPAAVREKLHPDLRMILIPAGPLHALPWAALRIDQDWLCQRATLQIMPGIDYASFVSLERPQTARCVMVGCGEFQGRAEDLPYISEELDQIAQAYEGGDIVRLEGEVATSQALIHLSEADGNPGYRFIHIATHAQMVAAHGLLAHIKFWDRELIFDEIASLSLKATLVVLSVCDGNLSEILPGEEVLSLSHAFLAAGAQAVVATLWPLEDEASPATMRIFYAGLAQGLDAAAALADMQRSCIGAGGRFAMPTLWAGLQLVGIDSPHPQ